MSLGLNILSLVIRTPFSSWRGEPIFTWEFYLLFSGRKGGGQKALPASVVFQVSLTQETRSESPQW